MGNRRAAAELRRDAEFEAFTAGAAGRLLHAAILLTGDPDAADRLLAAALAHVYANWFRMRSEDPYDHARTELVRRFAYRPWWQRPQGGILDRLSGQERLVVVLRLFEGIAEEQTAAQLGLPVERVRALCARATATLRSRRHEAGPADAPRSVAEARARQRAEDRRREKEQAADPAPGFGPREEPAEPAAQATGVAP